MKITVLDYELINENLMIALPNLSVEIDEDIIDLLFSNPRYISDDDNISIQKIYELNYDENHQHRLVVILYTHSEAVDAILQHEDEIVAKIKELKKIKILKPIRFSKDLLTSMGTKVQNYIQLKADTYPYNFLANSLELKNILKLDLSEKFNADLIIKIDSYEIKRRQNDQSSTNQEWLNKLNQYLDDFKANNLNKFEILNQKFQLSELDWNKIINSCFSRYSLTDSIKLEIISDQHPQQQCLITGLKKLVDKEKTRIETEIQVLIEKERKKNEKKTYNLDTLTEVQCKILKIENLIQWCQDNCSFDLEIRIETKNVYFKGAWEDIEKAKARLWDIINSTKEDIRHPLNIHLIEFLKSKTEYLINFQQENNLNCLVELHSDQISFRSIQPVADRFIQLLNSNIKVETIVLIDASLELINDSKFNTFAKQLENELKQSNESNLYTLKVSISEKKVFVIGIKLLVDRLVIDIKDFFDSNTIIERVYIENEIDLFSHENIKYLKVVKHAEISEHCERIRQQQKLVKLPFEILEDIPREYHSNGFKINSYRVKLKANKRTHDSLISYLHTLIDNNKVIDYFQMSSENMEVFVDPKIQQSLESLEHQNNCVILAPMYLDLLKNDVKSTKTPTINSELMQVDEETHFTCYLNRYENPPIKINVIDHKCIQSFNLDTLIISIDNFFHGLNNISKEVLKQAGPKVIAELEQLSKSEYNDQIYDGILFLTKPNDILKTNSIIHCVNPANNDDLVELDYLMAMIYKCLEKCEQRNYKRIGLNLIGSSCYNYLTSIDIIKLHIDTLTEYFLDPSVDSSIREINIVDNKLNSIIINSLTEYANNPASSIGLKELESPKKDSGYKKQIVKAVDKNLNLNSFIKVIYGSITDDNLKCDCIVNSTNSNLTLNNGLISAHILKMAGNSIQTELTQNYPQGLKNQLCAITTAGNLKNKKNIFHCCIPGYTDLNKKQLYKDIIYTLLNEALKLNLKSIAFPAFGSGNLNYPKPEVPRLMFKTINQYFKETNSKIEIFIVVYENDKETVKAFKDYLTSDSDQDEIDQDDSLSMLSDNDNDSLNEFKLKKESDSDSEFTENEKTFYRNFKSNDQLNECIIELNNVSLKTYIGDITKTTNDIIFNPTDSKLNLDGNITKSLILNGGNQIVTELKAADSNPYGFVWTSGGSLTCKKIIHVDVRTHDAKTAIVKALKETNDKNHQSITLPVIGTGNLGNDPKESIKNILDAIAVYISLMNQEKKKIKIKQIDICIFNKQQDYLKIFKNEMEKRLKAKYFKNEETSFLKKLFNYIAPQATNTSNTFFQQILNEKTSTDNQYEHKKFKLIANNKNTIDRIKQKLQEIAQNEMKTEELKNDYIKKLNFKSRSKIEEYCKKEFIKIEWDPHLSRVFLKGRPKNIIKCLSFIFSEISKHADDLNSQLSAELTAHTIQWEFQTGDKWQPFNIYLNNEIEKKYSNKSKNDHKYEFDNNKNEKCIVDVEHLIQYKKSDPNKRKTIRRNEIDKINTTIRFPDTWIAQKELDLILLNINTQEFKEVLNQIEKSGFKIGTGIQKVVSIQRIQNKRLFIQYQTHKEEFSKKYSNKTFERTLFHGTNEDCVEKIWKNGFNRSYAGKNATAFGRGVYFATSATYSNSYTDRRRGRPQGHIFVSKVLVGTSEVGNPNLNVPLNADTTVDNTTTPSIYVIYHDAQAYPDYLLTYE